MLDTNQKTTLIIAKGYNILDEVLQILSLLSIRFFTIKKLAKKHQNGYKMFNELYDNYNDEDSYLISLYKITNNFNDIR